MIFTYSRNDGEGTIEVAVPHGKCPPPRVRRKGKWWTKNVFAGSSSAHRSVGWPIASESMAVHPSQVAEATEHAKAHGVPTEINKIGQPIFLSPRHQREYLDIYKARNLDSYD
jgi:hypothetical protein